MTIRVINLVAALITLGVLSFALATRKQMEQSWQETRAMCEREAAAHAGLMQADEKLKTADAALKKECREQLVACWARCGAEVRLGGPLGDE